VLQEVAHRVRGAARDTDLVARQGGDEFLVLLADLEPGDGRDTVAEIPALLTDRIAEAIAEPMHLHAATLSMQVSIGTALFPDDAGDARSLLRLADAAMYERKRQRGHTDDAVERLA
jgi:diguanylate cyclase (GGDEF)-like protein